MTALSMAGNMLIGMAISAGIQLLITGLDNIINRTEKLIEAGEQAKQTISDINDAYTSKKDTVSSNKDRYIELSAGVDNKTNKNLSLATEDYEEFLSITNQLAETFPSLVTGYDSQGNALLSLSGNADETTASLEKLLEQERQLADFKISQNLQTAFDGTIAQIGQLQGEIDGLNNKLSDYEGIKKAFDTDIKYTLSEMGIDSDDKSYAYIDMFSADTDEVARDQMLRIQESFIKAANEVGLQDVILQSLDSKAFNGTDSGMRWTADLSALTQDQLIAFTDAYKAALTEIGIDVSEAYTEALLLKQQDIKEIQANWNSMVSSLITSMSVYDGYNELGDEIKQAINTGIGNIDPIQEWMDENGEIQAPSNIRAYLREKFLDPITNALDGAETAEAKEKINSAISELFSLNTSDINVVDYKKQVMNLVSQIVGDGNDKDSIIARTNFRVAYGITYIDEDGKEVWAIDDITKKISEETGLSDTKLHNEISQEDLNYVYNMIVQGNFDFKETGNWDAFVAWIDRIKGITDEVELEPITFSSILADDSDEGLSKKVDEFQSNISTIQSALDSLSNGEDIDLIDLKQEFPQITESAKDLGDTLTDLKNQQLGDLFKEIYDSTKKLSDTSAVTDFISDVISAYNVSESDLAVIRSNILSSLLPNASNTLERQEIIQSINNLFNGITINAKANLDVEIENFNSFLEIQDKLNAAMASSVTATGLTTEEIENVANAYKNLEGYDPEKLFERTANGVHLNTAEVRKLDEQLRQNTMTDFLQAVADKQIELNQAREQGLDTSQLENELSVLQQLASQYDGLTSAYQRWLDAKSGGEEGDMYRSVTDTMIERGKELYDAELYNNKEFRAIADFYSNQDLTNATAEQVKSAYEQALPAIEKYFTAGREGIDAFVTDMKQLSDAEGLGWVTELEDGSLSFNTGSDKEIADRLGIDVEAIQSIYRMMSEYVDGIVIGDTSGLNAFTAQVESAQQKLSELQQNGEISSSISLDYDVNEMSLDEITAKIEELKGERVEIDAETNPEAAEALDDLIAKTEQAYYFKLNVDTDGGLDKASSAINGIQQRISELSTENPVLSVSAIVNGDEQIQTLAEELASLPPEVQTTVGITTENVGNVSGIISQLAQNPESISVPVNYTKGSEPETVDAAEGIANFTLGTSPKEVPDATGVANFRLGTYPTSLPTLTQFIRRVEIDSEATGTMLSPAHAKGSVALPQDETALVNELGQESRIHNGIWELLPPGMHVQKLDKGDIILSARQTADLLKAGKAHGIGKAYADGTAFNGMPAHSSGGWTIGGSSNTGSSTSSSNNSNNNNSGNAITNTINRVTNAVTRNLETFQKWLEKLVDWVEVRIQRINDRIDLYTAQSGNAIGYRNQNSLLARAQRWNDNLLRDQQRGRDRYLQQANQVTEEAIASHLLNGNNDTQRRARANTLIDRIQNGYIDINEYNENEREFITAYTEWYDRAVELNLAIEETIANQRDLEQQRFENIADEYDNIISLIEHRSNMINEQMSQNEAAGYVGSRAYYQLLAGDARERQQRLQEEQRLLAENLQRSMNWGYIQYGDERWYAMQDQINQVSEELQSVNGELIKS